MKTNKLIWLCFLFVGKYGVSQDNNIDKFSFFNLGSFGKDTMYIRTIFTECGEWGGHLEDIKIYFSGGSCFARYEKYSADCDSMKINNGVPTQIAISKLTKKIGPFEQLLIRDYIHSLVDQKFSEADFGHAFIVNEVNFRSELNLYVKNWSPEVATSYDKLKSAFTE